MGILVIYIYCSIVYIYCKLYGCVYFKKCYIIIGSNLHWFGWSPYCHGTWFQGGHVCWPCAGGVGRIRGRCGTLHCRSPCCWPRPCGGFATGKSLVQDERKRCLEYLIDIWYRSNSYMIYDILWSAHVFFETYNVCNIYMSIVFLGCCHDVA